jgi:membrane protease YdiL (CAAX protease family)
MNVAAAPVIAAALLVVVSVVLRAYFSSRGETDTGDRVAEFGARTPRERCFKIVVVFGGPLMLIVLGTIVGVLVWDLSLETVGLYGNPVRELAIGLLIAPVVVVFAEALGTLLEHLGQESSGNSSEVLGVTTLSGLGWMLGAITVQASAEEVFFRAALVGAPAALLSVSAWYFVVPVAVLFGLLHFDGGIGKILYTSIMGVIFGAVFVVGGILAAVVAHVLHNQWSVIEDYREESSTSSSSHGTTQDS